MPQVPELRTHISRLGNAIVGMKMDSESTFVLLLFCSDCGGALELECKVEPHLGEQHPAHYNCPYCATRQTLRFSGQILWAVARHPDAPVDPPVL
jgi:hypothetical protein